MAHSWLTVPLPLASPLVEGGGHDCCLPLLAPTPPQSELDMHKGEANRLRREMERVEGERERLREEARRWVWVGWVWAGS